MRQAIIWIKDGKFTDAYMRHSVIAYSVMQLLF